MANDYLNAFEKCLILRGQVVETNYPSLVAL